MARFCVCALSPSLVVALALLISSSAFAVGVINPPPPPPITISEGSGAGHDGEYTINNATSDLYIFAFLVTNPSSAELTLETDNAGWTYQHVDSANWDLPMEGEGAVGPEDRFSWAQIFGTSIYPFADPANAYFVDYSVSGDIGTFLNPSALIGPGETLGGFFFDFPPSVPVVFASDGGTGSLQGGDPFIPDNVFSDDGVPVTDAAPAPESSSIAIWSVLGAFGLVSAWRMNRLKLSPHPNA
ncbi:MAG TPA: hypothetical protein VGJ04_05215 [Pirellulales bacterium]|jgi:hypothetical protein